MKRAFLGLAMACAMGLTGAVPAPLKEENLHPLALALELSARIPDRGLRVTGYIRIALAYWEVGADEDAEVALALAMEEALGGPGPLERRKSLFQISGRLQDDHSARALEVLELAIAKGAGQWPDSGSNILGLASRYLALGAEDEAILIAAGAGVERAGRWHAEAFAKHLHRQGDTARALAMQEVGLRSWRENGDMEKDWNAPLWTLGQYAERMGDYGGEARAVALLEEAAGLLEEPVVSSGRVRDLSRLAIQAVRAERVDLAEVFLAGALESVPAEEEGRQIYGVRQNIGSALAWLGRVDEAVAIVDTIEEPMNWELALSKVVYALMAAGHRMEAEMVAMGTEDDRRRSWALVAVGRGWLEAGEPWRALEVFVLVPTRRGIRGQEGLLRFWRTEGNLEGLLEFIERATIPDIRVRAVHHAAMAINDRGATKADLPLLQHLLGVVEESEERENFDSLWKKFPLATLARQFNAIGRQEEALKALRFADEALMRYTHPCDVSMYPSAMAAEKEARLEGCLQASLDDPLLDHRNRANDLAYIAGTYADIGEYGMALDMARRTGPIHDDWQDTANDAYPILSALRRIGKAYLKNGDQPSPEELVVLGELRDQALGNPDWRTDPLGAAMREAALIDDPEQRAIERANMYLDLQAAGVAQAAAAVLDLAIEEALELPEPSDRANALLEMARHLGWAGEDELTASLLLRALEEGGDGWLSGEQRNRVVTIALEAESRAVADLAWEGVEEPTRSHERAIYLAPFLAEQGEIEEARTIVTEGLDVRRALGDTEFDGGIGPNYVLRFYAQWYLEIGELDLARDLITEAAEAIVVEENWGLAFMAGMRLARLAHRVGDQALAVELLGESHALALASQEYRWWRPGGFSNWWEAVVTNGSTPADMRDLNYLHLARGYLGIEMWDESRDMGNLISTKAYSESVWRRLGVALAKDGQEDAALEIAARIVEVEHDTRYSHPASEIISAVALQRLDNGQPEQAWALLRGVEFQRGTRAPFRLIRHWREEGDIEALLEYVSLVPDAALAALGAWQAALAIEDKGVSSSDVPLLTGLVPKVLDRESVSPADEVMKTRPLLEIARILHASGEHSEAVLAMEAAEGLIERWDPACAISVGYPSSPAMDRFPYCSRQAQTSQDLMRANASPPLAGGWAEIGEFGRAFALVERMGPIEEPWRDTELGRFPRLEALRAIGIAMLEQGVLPPSYLESLVDSARQGDLVPGP
ncbi:hypothetical protein IIA16_01165 [bacterium]|nr:hypothetical protein [bacterium]